jgi:hypothetical protein
VSQLTFPTAPGVYVNISAAVGGSGNPADQAKVFMVGITDRGPTVPTRVLDLLDFVAKFGGRNSGSAIAYDSVEFAFGMGANELWFNRVVGATPTYGAYTFQDRNGSPVNTMRVTSAFYGSQSANISVGIAAGTVANTFDVLVYDTASPSPSTPVEAFRDNSSVANAVAAINASSSYITATDLASASSGTAAFPALTSGVGQVLTAGTDDRTTASDTTWNNAASAFPANLGGGLLLAPGRYTSSFHLMLMTAAVAQGREAILDGPPQPQAADVTSLALSDSTGTGHIDPGDSAMGFSPWALLSPAPGGSVPRTVPLSAGVAGLISSVDARSGHSNQAAMGAFGSLDYAVGLAAPAFNATDRATANGRQGTTGWNVCRQVPGQPPQVFGFRTVSAAARSYFGANVRETLSLKRIITDIGDSYVGSMIDGQGRVFMDLANDIGAVLRAAYDAGALFGATSTAAYNVDVSGTVNTPQSIAAGIIRARVWFIPSPTGEKVVIDLVRQAVPTS